MAKSVATRKRATIPRKPALLSKEQRAAIERELSVPYGRVVLKADGHELQLRVECYKALRYSVMVYVDGWLRGEWFKAESDIGAKFWHRHTRVLFKAKDHALYRRAFGKRALDERIARSTYVVHMPSFNSGRAALASLQRTCESIEVVSVGYQAGESDEVRQEVTADA